MISYAFMSAVHSPDAYHDVESSYEQFMISKSSNEHQ